MSDKDLVSKISRQDYVANERLYLDSTRTKVHVEGDKECAFLLAAKGQIIPPKEIVRLGLDKAEPAKIGPTKITTASPDEIKNRATR
jgi:hypothetical protein